MRKFLSAALAVLMIVSMLPMAVFAAGDSVAFSMGTVTCKPGERISVPLYVESSASVNSLALSELTYDTSLLTFVEFEDYTEIVTDSFFGSGTIDAAKMTIMLGYMENVSPSGRICNVVFDVNADVAKTTSVEINMTPLAKSGSVVFESSFAAGQVEIQVAGEEPVIPDTDAPKPETTEAEVIFTFDDVIAEAGQTIHVGLYITSESLVNSIALENLVYDTEYLELVEFTNLGKFVSKAPLKLFDTSAGVIAIGMMEKLTFSEEKICDFVFKVKENAPYGSAVITMHSIVKDDSLEYVTAVEAGNVHVGTVDYTFGNVYAGAGETFRVPLYIEANAEINSVALSDLKFDASAFTFVGFDGWQNSEIIANAQFPVFDEEKGVVAFSTLNGVPEKLSGYICDLVFSVNDNAEPAAYHVGMGNAITKLDSAVIFSTVYLGAVSVGSAVIKAENVMALPGDTIDVPVYVEALWGDMADIDLVPVDYDTTKLEFVGYVFGDEVTPEINGLEDVAEGELLLNLRFKVKENAAGGAVQIPMEAHAYSSYGHEIKCEVKSATVAIGKAVISVGAVTGDVGEKVLVPVTVSTTAPIIGIYLNDLTFDAKVFTLVGYDTTALEAKGITCKSVADGGLELTIPNNGPLSEVTFYVEFAISEDAEDNTYDVTFGASAARGVGNILYTTEVTSGSVETVSGVTGDINGDGAVNVQDALYLFLNTMLPGKYPMTYKKPIDFTKDGQVNVQDALYLFLFSMLPGKYPID